MKRRKIILWSIITLIICFVIFSIVDVLLLQRTKTEKVRIVNDKEVRTKNTKK